MCCIVQWLLISDFSANVMVLSTDPTSRDGSFILTTNANINEWSLKFGGWNHSCHCTSRPMLCMCINKVKLCHGILSHVEKHNKLHDLSDSNCHFQKIMSISFNSRLKTKDNKFIRSIYHIKTILVLDSIDFKSYVSACTSFPKILCYQLPRL